MIEGGFMLRRTYAVAVAVIVAAMLVGGLATPASAAISSDPDPTWMTNGQIRAMVRFGNYIYIGGKFTQVRASTSPGPGEKFAARNLARINVTTGLGDPSWTPDVVGSTAAPAVHALTVAGGDVWVGGDFQSVNGQPRHNLAAVSVATGAVVAGVDPVVGASGNRSVRALAQAGGRVFAGGYFKSVDGSPRRFLAAFGLDGALQNWKPRVDKRVFSLAMGCDGDRLFAGGQFRRAGGDGDAAWSARETVAAFDPASGALEAWHVPVGTIEEGQKAYAMAPTCTQLNVAYGGNNRAIAFRLDNGTSGDKKWQVNTSGNVQAITVAGGQIVIGGHFTSIGGLTRNRIAALSMSSGAVDPGFNPSLTGQWGGPWALTADASHLYVGGQFTMVGPESRTFFARFRV
jgi:hypothetical protein